MPARYPACKKQARPALAQATDARRVPRPRLAAPSRVWRLVCAGVAAACLTSCQAWQRIAECRELIASANAGLEQIRLAEQGPAPERYAAVEGELTRLAKTLEELQLKSAPLRTRAAETSKNFLEAATLLHSYHAVVLQRAAVIAEDGNLSALDRSLQNLERKLKQTTRTHAADVRKLRTLCE